MKRTLILSLAAAALVCSCAKVNPQTENLVAEAQKEIGFQVAKAVASTKADSFSGSVFEDENGFGAYAWQTGNASTTYFMNAQQITKQQVSGVYYWKPSNRTYYWPKEGTVDFECFAPYNNGTCWYTVSDDASNAASNGKANKITAHLEVSTTSPCADLMYSDKAINCNGSSSMNEVEDGVNAYTGVPVIFRHALAMSQIQIKASAVQDAGAGNFAVITFKSATLKNVRMEGDLTLTLLTTGETTSTRKWYNDGGVWDTTGAGTDDYDNTLTGGTVIGTTPQDIIGQTIVIPQIISDQAIEVDFSIDIYDTTPFKKDDNGNIVIGADGKPVLKDGVTTYPDPYSHEDIHSSVNLIDIIGGGQGDTWGIGESTNYVITINPFTSEITFDPCVAGWTEVSGTQVK